MAVIRLVQTGGPPSTSREQPLFPFRIGTNASRLP